MRPNVVARWAVERQGGVVDVRRKLRLVANIVRQGDG